MRRNEKNKEKGIFFSFELLLGLLAYGMVGITQCAAKYLDAQTDPETVSLGARIRRMEKELAIEVINRIRLTKI